MTPDFTVQAEELVRGIYAIGGVIACRLARAIIDQETASTVDDKDIARVTLAHIDVALEGAKRSFATAFDR